MPTDPHLYKFKVDKGKIYTLNLEDGQISKDPLVNDFENPVIIKNESLEYPFTGGQGVLIFTIGGLITMTLAIVSYYIKTKKSIK